MRQQATTGKATPSTMGLTSTITTPSTSLLQSSALTPTPSERDAQHVLPGVVFNYYAGGAGDDRSVHDNVAAFRRIHFIPRCLLRDVSCVSTQTTLRHVGRLSFPALIAPMALQRLAHRDGEIGAAVAAKRHGIPYIVSSFATTPLEDIGKAISDTATTMRSAFDHAHDGEGHETFVSPSVETLSASTSLLFQLYLFKDRAVSARLLRRAVAGGYKVIVLTVDAPRFGQRRRDAFLNSKKPSSSTSSSSQPSVATQPTKAANRPGVLPEHVQICNIETSTTSTSTTPMNGNITNGSAAALLSNSSTGEHPSVDDLPTLMADTFSEDDVRWVRNVTGGLPVWVKGLLHTDDAVRAIQAGASGIVVSNHGGRQLEGCIPSMCALPQIARTVAHLGATVVVDSGIRSGADIVRAVALGADAVLIGRPVLWALANDGRNGVDKLIGELRRDMETTMALCGVNKVSDIDSSLVSHDRRVPSL